MISDVKNYIDNNRQRFLDELLELLKIPSVSADPAFKDDVYEAADFIKNSLEEAGADNVKAYETEGFPVVYGEKKIDPSLPTVVIYGHYDVQPADPYELWETSPFEPTIKDEKIYARGASDDKGQMYMHIKAFEAMMETGNLPCNVKFMIEGEEEVGSPSLEKFATDNYELLKGDVILISDTALLSKETPTITVGIRGISYVEVEVTGPNRDLHSGLYGGGVPNPAFILTEMISALKDPETRKIQIPGFYDKVRELSDEERQAFNQIPFDEEAYRKGLELKGLDGEAGYNTYERLSIRPCLDVNGIVGGYIKEGAKTVIPAKASAKISMRLVPDQDHEEITQLFKDYFHKVAPDNVQVNVTSHHGANPVMISTESKEYQAASKAFEEAWGKKPLPYATGGSIPIVSFFEKKLGLQSVLMGFGLESDGIHSPNERFELYNFYKGIETIPGFYKHYSSRQ